MRSDENTIVLMSTIELHDWLTKLCEYQFLN